MAKRPSDRQGAHLKTILTAWRSDLQSDSKHYPELRLYLVVTPHMALSDRLLILQQGLRDPDVTGTDERVTTTHTWVTTHGAQEHGVLVGPLVGVNRFLAVATTLGSCLPLEMRPTKPFHDLGGPSPAQYDGRVAGDSAANTVSAAVERANKAGLDITLKWLTTSAHKHGVRVRPRQLAGNHRKEAEWNSLAGYLLKRPRPENSSDEEALSSRIEETRERRRKERPLD
jgi:hypothetical protein